MPSPDFALSAVFTAGMALIFILALLLIVKRPSLPAESSGAVALTLAAVILLSGAWSMWLSPTYETRKYDETASASLSVGPLGTATYAFDARKNQEVEVQIDAPFLITREPPPPPGKEPPSLPVFSVNIYDPEGRIHWAQPNATKGVAAQMAPVTISGTYRVEVRNPQREVLNLLIRIIDRTRVTVRPLEPVGQWLALISLPIFGLGGWFLLSGRPRRQLQ